MDRSRVKWYFLAILLLAALLRLSFLGTFPPGGEGAFWLRLPTAFAGIASIGLLIYLVQKLANNPRIGLLTGLVLTIMPWHIEQSRVYSHQMLGLCTVLAGAALIIHIKQKAIRLFLLLATIAIFYVVYPSFWMFNSNWDLPTFREYLGNLFRLVSIEFLFFKNDSFWSGGYRTVGALLPTFIPFFLIGVWVALQEVRLRHLLGFMPGIIFLVLAAANPLFPEQGEFFMITPYISLICALGIYKLFEHIKSANFALKAILIVLLLSFCYEYVIFTHFYIKHYSSRVKNEASYETRIF